MHAKAEGMPAPSDRFAGKVALVTGVTSGIGRATALAFAAQGASVAACGRDFGRGSELEAELQAAGAEAVFISADLGKSDAPAAVIAEVQKRLGRLDIAFNCAGHLEERGMLLDQPLDVFEKTFSVNVRSVFLMMQAQIAAMLPAGGAIINAGSVSGVRQPNPGFSIYSASKAAVLMMTKTAAMEHAHKNIRINAVSPGRVLTPMMRKTGILDVDAVAANLPIRRLGEPDEVAAAVLWLASDEASFVVGQNLSVDGGFLSQ